mgnify:CR=1 FL=1
MLQLKGDNAAHMPAGPDLKWRFFWRVGPRPAATQFAELNAPPVVPPGFPQWTDVMDGWGGEVPLCAHTHALSHAGTRTR